jgi:hypothetical protein
MIISMATILSEVSSPLAVDLWQLDQIRDLFERGFSIEEITEEVNLDPMLVREVLEIRYSHTK